MPHRPASPCTAPGCPRVSFTRRCLEHTRLERREYHLQHPDRNRAYGASWRKLRAAVLRDEPSCRQCGDPSTDIDHIVPLRRGGSHSRENLQGLCHSCHSRKTVVEDGGWGRRATTGQSIQTRMWMPPDEASVSVCPGALRALEDTTASPKPSLLLLEEKQQPEI